MKKLICLLLLSVFILGCRKGKKMPETIYVHYDGPAAAGIWPQGPFSHFDPFDIFEPDRYPSYLHVSDADDFASDFNDELKKLFVHNNIVFTTDTAAYSLSVSIGVSESLHREHYVDSCSSDYELAYVYYSSLSANATVSLKKNGVEVDHWNRNASSTERLRDKTDSCNQPKILRARWPSTLFSQLASETRMVVSRRMYQIEVKQ